MRWTPVRIGVLWLALTLALHAQIETRVYSLFAAPGDWFTHSGANYAFFPFFHQWNWYYGHVQHDGVVGIRTDYPRSGNGSVYFYTPTTLAKSDIEFRFLDGQSYWGRRVTWSGCLTTGIATAVAPSLGTSTSRCVSMSRTSIVRVGCGTWVTSSTNAR
jgi:hypothetical protein